MRHIRYVGLFFVLVVAGLSGKPAVSAQDASHGRDDASDGRDHASHGRDVARARATLNSCVDGSVVGSADLFEAPSSEGIKNVTIVLSTRNITGRKHGVHIHEVGACTPCSAAGSHLDLGPFGNNLPVIANHPYHSGDLINLEVGKGDKGFMTHVSSRVSLSDGNLSIFDADGASLVIHALEDTYCSEDPTDPNCAGGGRVACGVIHRVQ